MGNLVLPYDRLAVHHGDCRAGVGSISVNSDFIIWLDTRSSLTPQVIGGKFFGLRRLLDLGVSVPSAFAISTHAYKSEVGDIASEIEQRLRSVGLLEHDSMLEELRNIMVERPLGKELTEVIISSYERLCELGATRAVAVRSSATCEDSIIASHAGQYDTYLGVRGASNVLDAVTDCWASLYCKRAVRYRISQPQEQAEPAMAVIVQQMVDARAAGVFMTANPMTGSKDELVVECIFGLGAPLVSGTVTPDLFILDRESGTIKTQRIVRKHNQLIIDSADAVRTVPLPATDRAEPSLSAQLLQQIKEIAERVDPRLTASLEGEFAVTKTNQVQMLQLRAMTSLRPELESAPHSGTSLLNAVLKALSREGPKDE
jgi:pyruvate,water dikinase